MAKERKFVCLANGQNTKVTVLVIVDGMIEERVSDLDGVREASEELQARFNYALKPEDCFGSYEAYREAVKEGRAA